MASEAPSVEEVQQQVSDLSVESVSETPVNEAPAVESPAEKSDLSSSSSSNPTTPTEPASGESVKKRFSMFGGGGQKCTVCSKTSYPAETIQFEMCPYHIDCFKCTTCTKKLEAFQAAKFEGNVYCRACFSKHGFNRKQAEVKWDPSKASSTPSLKASQFGGGGQACTKCTQTVYAGETIQFEQKPYHPKCFTCSECSKELVASETGQFEGNLYCKRCWEKGGYVRKQTQVRAGSTTTNALASKFGGGGQPCTTCNLTVYASETIQYDMKPYHQKCFCCSECKKELVPSEASQFEGKLFCKTDWEKGGYARKQTQVRAGSTSTNALASKFGGGGNPCAICSQTVYAGETIQYEQKPYHQKCFTCSECSKELIPSDANQFEGKLYCKRDWEKGGFARKQTEVKQNDEKPKQYNSRFANLGGGGMKCTICTTTVYSAETLMYEGKPYHQKCFKCSHCSKEIQQVAQAEHKHEKVYCKKCFQELGLWQATLDPVKPAAAE